MFDRPRWAMEYAELDEAALAERRKNLSGQLEAYQEAVIQMEWMKTVVETKIDLLENEIRLRAERRQ